MTRTFPWRELFADEGAGLRGLPAPEFLVRWGHPDATGVDTWTYTRVRDEATLAPVGDPKSVRVTFTLEAGCIAHAAIELVFRNDLEYREILW